MTTRYPHTYDEWGTCRDCGHSAMDRQQRPCTRPTEAERIEDALQPPRVCKHAHKTLPCFVCRKYMCEACWAAHRCAMGYTDHPAYPVRRPPQIQTPNTKQ